MPKKLRRKWRGRNLDYIKHVIKAIKLALTHDEKETAKAAPLEVAPVLLVEEPEIVTAMTDVLNYFEAEKAAKIEVNC